MPIDSSIYQNLKPIEMPDLMGTAKKAMNLSQMGLSQKKMQQEMDAAQISEQLRKASIVGNALETLSGMKPDERRNAYPQLRNKLIQDGILKPEEAPEDYDEGFISQNVVRYQNSKEGIEMAKQRAEVEKLKREKTGGDPLARQMAMLEAREEAAKRKEDEKLRRYTNMGGWTLSEGATPTMDDAKKFKSGSAAARTLLSNLNEFQGLIEKHGAEVMPGEVKTRLNSLARDIQLNAKNEDLYGLGVLTGPDLQLLEEIIDAPTGFWENLNPMAGKMSQNKAQQFRDMINTRINSKAKTYGFEPTQEWRELSSNVRGQKKEESPGLTRGNEAYAGEAPQMPEHGTVEKDEKTGVSYIFMGGHPGDRRNWKREK